MTAITVVCALLISDKKLNFPVLSVIQLTREYIRITYELRK